MMLQAILFILACVVQTRGASEPPTECPQWCTCEESSVQCVRGGIPKMDQKITQFLLEDANPPLPELSPAITTHMQDLISLEFDGAGLTTIQPEALGLMKHLDHLSLTNNNITVIYNNTFVYCSTLVTLSLDNNNIQTIQEGSFASLHHLQKLSLSNNSLTIMPKYLPTHLQFLSVQHNLIQEASQINLHNLTFLNLCYNLIVHINPKQINLKNLKELCLGGNKFTLNGQLITQEHFPILESLELKGTSRQQLLIPDTTLKNIQNMSTTTLTTLELDFCSISSLRPFKDMSALDTLRMKNVIVIATRMSPTVFQLPLITVLDFTGSPGLARSFLKSPPTRLLNSLKILRMPWCGITSLPQSFQKQKLPNITHLDLSFNPLTCTCDLSWIPDYVRDGKLILEKETHTICDQPKHLQNIALLTATLCPIARTLSTTIMPELTLTTHMITPTSLLNATNTNTATPSLPVLPEVSTESSGESSKTNVSHPDSTPNGPTMGRNIEKLVLAIFGSIAATIIVAYLLLVLRRHIMNHYKARNFNVCDANYSSQQRLTLQTF